MNGSDYLSYIKTILTDWDLLDDKRGTEENVKIRIIFKNN